MDTTQEPSIVATVPDSPVEAMASPGVPWVSRPLCLRCANREDVLRVPARLENLVPPDHPARQVWETVKSLDLSEFYADLRRLGYVMNRVSPNLSV